MEFGRHLFLAEAVVSVREFSEISCDHALHITALELESEILHQGPHDSAVWAVVFVPFFTNQTHDLIKRC